MLAQIYDWGIPNAKIETERGKIPYQEYLEIQKRRLEKPGDRQVETQYRGKNGVIQIALFATQLCLEPGCREPATRKHYCRKHDVEAYNRKFERPLERTY